MTQRLDGTSTTGTFTPPLWSAARDWMRRETDVFLATVDAWSDEDWDVPSLLPGWRRREVVAHVHHNAEAVRNLTAWARTGVETPMYASMEARNDDIARSADLPVEELRELVHVSAAALDTELGDLTPEQRATEVRTSSGAWIGAEQLPWSRAREVSIHTVDLDSGIGFDDLADGLVEALVRDVVDFRLRRGQAATLAAWLTGRGVEGTDIGPWM